MGLGALSSYGGGGGTSVGLGVPYGAGGPRGAGGGPMGSTASLWGSWGSWFGAEGVPLGGVKGPHRAP